MSGLLFSGRVEVDVTDFPSHRHSLHQFLPLSPDKKAAYPSQFKLALPDRRGLFTISIINYYSNQAKFNPPRFPALYVQVLLIHLPELPSNAH